MCPIFIKKCGIIIQELGLLENINHFDDSFKSKLFVVSILNALVVNFVRFILLVLSAPPKVHISVLFRIPWQTKDLK